MRRVLTMKRDMDDYDSLPWHTESLVVVVVVVVLSESFHMDWQGPSTFLVLILLFLSDWRLWHEVWMQLGYARIGPSDKWSCVCGGVVSLVLSISPHSWVPLRWTLAEQQRESRVRTDSKRHNSRRHTDRQPQTYFYISRRVISVFINASNTAEGGTRGNFLVVLAVVL